MHAGVVCLLRLRTSASKCWPGIASADGSVGLDDPHLLRLAEQAKQADCRKREKEIVNPEPQTGKTPKS